MEPLTMDHLTPGEYIVFFANNDEIDAKYQTAGTSSLRITVDKGANTFDFVVERTAKKSQEAGQKPQQNPDPAAFGKMTHSTYFEVVE